MFPSCTQTEMHCLFFLALIFYRCYFLKLRHIQMHCFVSLLVLKCIKKHLFLSCTQTFANATTVFHLLRVFIQIQMHPSSSLYSHIQTQTFTAFTPFVKLQHKYLHSILYSQLQRFTNKPAGHCFTEMSQLLLGDWLPFPPTHPHPISSPSHSPPCSLPYPNSTLSSQQQW